MRTRASLTIQGGGSEVKNPPENAGDKGSVPGSGRSPGKGNGDPLQYSCPGKSHGQRSGAGYRLWGPKRVERNLATKQQMRTYCIAQGARPKCSEVA